MPQFLLRGLTWSVLHVRTQNYLQNVGTCPGRPLQLLTRNHFFQSERPEPPLIYIMKLEIEVVVLFVYIYSVLLLLRINTILCFTDYESQDHDFGIKLLMSHIYVSH